MSFLHLDLVLIMLGFGWVRSLGISTCGLRTQWWASQQHLVVLRGFSGVTKDRIWVQGWTVMVTKYLENIFLPETKAWIVQHKVLSQSIKRLCVCFKGFWLFHDHQVLPHSVCSGKTTLFPSELSAFQAGLVLPLYTMALWSCSSQIWPHALNKVDSPILDRSSTAAYFLHLWWLCCIVSNVQNFSLAVGIGCSDPE